MCNLLKILYQNTRGLRSKIVSGIRNRISLADHDIFCLTETWLCDRFDSESIFDGDVYVTHRADRNERTYERPNNSGNSSTNELIGGGALIAIKKNISAFRMKHWEQEISFDNVWLRVNTTEGKKIFINCIYLNHSSNFHKFNIYLKHLQDIVNVREPNSEFIIVGDFNIRSIEWYATPNCCIALSHEGRLADELINTLVHTELSQMNSVKNHQHRILDLVLTNFPNTGVTVTDGIVQEDAYHPALLIKINASNIKFMKSKRAVKNNFFKGNYTAINSILNATNWSQLFDGLNINDSMDQFYQLIEQLIDQFIPKIQPRAHDFPKWYSPKLIRLIKEKEYYCKHKNNSSIYTQLFNDKRREIKHEKKKCLFEYESNVESLITTNPKSFFAYTKSLRKSNSLPAVMHFRDRISENMKETSNLFAEYFSSVYSTTGGIDHLDCNNECNNYFQIPMADIINVITKLDANKTNSPDGIPSLFYIRTANFISVPLELLFNKSISEMIYPERFKVSFVSPIHKSGDTDNIENYRPISILSAVAKIFDKLIYVHLLSKTSHLISRHQHGFTSGKSTLTNLLKFTDYLSNNMMRGGPSGHNFHGFG